MSNQERDKFLTQVMGECWHNVPAPFDNKADIPSSYFGTCRHCQRKFTIPKGQRYNNLSFSTWTGFGKLWEWAQKQEWWDNEMLIDTQGMCEIRKKVLTSSNWWDEGCIGAWFIHPDRFADAIYQYLKEAKQ